MSRICNPEEVEIGGRSTITAKAGDIGIGIDNSISTGSATYNYKFNGKELQDELGLNFYDYGARNYDPSIGRWFNVDPLAGKSVDNSPYNYVANDPVGLADLDGRDDRINIMRNKEAEITGIYFSATVYIKESGVVNFPVLASYPEKLTN